MSKSLPFIHNEAVIIIFYYDYDYLLYLVFMFDTEDSVWNGEQIASRQIYNARLQ